MDELMNSCWEKYNMCGKYLKSRSGVTTGYEAFTHALFNADMLNSYETYNMRLTRKALEKEMERRKEIERIDNILKNCKVFSSLRNIAKELQKQMVKPDISDITFIIFRYKEQWYIKSYINELSFLQQIKTYKELDTKAIEVNANSFRSYKFDDIVDKIKYYRDFESRCI